MWGLPELLQLDNAAEFHSRALVRGAQEYGIRIEYRPPGTPHFGGHIEIDLVPFTSYRARRSQMLPKKVLIHRKKLRR